MVCAPSQAFTGHPRNAILSSAELRATARISSEAIARIGGGAIARIVGEGRARTSGKRRRDRGEEEDNEEGGRDETTHTILNRAAVKPNHIYRSVIAQSHEPGESEKERKRLTAGPRLASVPPNSNAL